MTPSDIPRSFEVVRGGLPLPVVLSCCHASGTVPEELGTLGMDPDVLEGCAGGRDRGAAWLFGYLADVLDCWGIRNGASRLVIDTNRYLDQSDLIPTRWDNRPVPANEALSEAGRTERIEKYWKPYHRALHGLLEECEQRHGSAFHFCVHAMAESFEGQVRRSDVSLICNAGRGLVPPIRRSLEESGYSVAINEPYTLDRDIVRAPEGSAIERFNANSVIIEINEKHRGDEAVADAIRRAIEVTVQG